MYLPRRVAGCWSRRLFLGPPTREVSNDVLRGTFPTLNTHACVYACIHVCLRARTVEHECVVSFSCHDSLRTSSTVAPEREKLVGEIGTTAGPLPSEDPPRLMKHVFPSFPAFCKPVRVCTDLQAFPLNYCSASMG